MSNQNNDVVQPTLSQWIAAYEEIRQAIADWRHRERDITEAAFCKRYEVPASHFSRAMNRKETPSIKLLEAINAVVPDVAGKFFENWRIHSSQLYRTLSEFSAAAEKTVAAIGHPGEIVVFSAIDMDNRAEPLQRFLGSFLAADAGNELRFLFSDSRQTWEAWSRAVSEEANLWPRWDMSRNSSLGIFINKVLDFAPTAKPAELAAQVRVQELRLLEVGQRSAELQEMASLLVGISACQLFGPHTAYALYRKKGADAFSGRHFSAFVYTSTSEDAFAWLPLTADSAASLVLFDNLVQRLAQQPVLRNVTLEALSPRLAMRLMNHPIEGQENVARG